MSDATTWTDAERNELRAALRAHILGELRLGLRDADDILTACAESHIDDTCPDEERDDFVEYATSALATLSDELDAERRTWPAVTDCDRMDKAEAALRERGIILWQVSPCCDTCTMGEFEARADAVEKDHPGLRARLRGYAFFIDQTLPEMLAEGTQIQLFLGYGWISPDVANLPTEQYQPKAIAIGHEVVACMAAEGLAVAWDGVIERKIGVSVDWKRRAQNA